jgi:hypothetical protein
MASYSQLLGRNITVQYRTGGFLLPASGTLVADSGRSIFLEQHLLVRGKQTYFRWEIPYQYIHRLEEVPAPADQPVPEGIAETAPDPADDGDYPLSPLARAANASGSPSLISFPQPHKT